MEAAVSNTCSAGDTVIVVNGGKFGERWLKISQAFGVKVVELKVEWGKAVHRSMLSLRPYKAHPRSESSACASE